MPRDLIAQRDISFDRPAPTNSVDPYAEVPHPADMTPRVGDGNTDSPLTFLTLHDLASMPPPQWLVSGLLDLDSLALMYGRRGAHKSFLAVDMLASIAGGIRWHGRSVEMCPVVYVVAEGVGGLGQRFDAWYEAHPNQQPSANIHLYPRAINLLSPSTVGAFADACASLGARLVVLDTLARCLVGGDENSAKDAGLAVEQLDVIRRRTRACVLVVHHAGKDGTKGGRGSTAFEAAADTVLEVGSTDNVVTITTTKQKNHVEPRPTRLRAVPIGASVVLNDYTPDSAAMPESVISTLQTLVEIAVPGGIPTSRWLVAVGAPDRTFYRHLKRLLDDGLIENVGSEKMPRYQATDLGTATTATVLP